MTASTPSTGSSPLLLTANHLSADNVASLKEAYGASGTEVAVAGAPAWSIGAENLEVSIVSFPDDELLASVVSSPRVGTPDYDADRVPTLEAGITVLEAFIAQIEG